MKFFVYRNCFSGDMSGGDMHTGGFCEWVHANCPELSVSLVHPEGDGQEAAYSETANLQNITYKDTRFSSAHTLRLLLRAYRGVKRVQLPWGAERNILVAGSHFVADVWPVWRQGRKRQGVQRVVYIHHIVQDMPRPKSFNTFAANVQEKICFAIIKRHFNQVITVNQDVVEGLRRRGFRQDILVSSNFVSDNMASPKRYEDKDITIYFCGRLVEQKGVMDFLEVCKHLQLEWPDFRAVMCGQGPELENLRRIVSEGRLKVEVRGRVPEAEKYQIISRSKLFVLPSIEEGWGIVIAEALSLGTPAVVYDLPVYEPIFGNHIRKTPLLEVGVLAQHVSALLRLYHADSKAYAREQADITAFAKSFSRDSVISKELKFMMEC